MSQHFYTKPSKRPSFSLATRPTLASIVLLALGGCSSQVGGGPSGLDTGTANVGAMNSAGGVAVGATNPDGTTIGTTATGAGGAGSVTTVNADGTVVSTGTGAGGAMSATTAGTVDASGGATGVGGAAPVVVDCTGIEQATSHAQLRLLTQPEYRNSVQALFGGIDVSTLTLPDDTSVAGFTTVGAAEVTVAEVLAEDYENASRALTSTVFGNPQSLQTLVGCTPQADLSDACVDTFIRSFGRRAFRRDLTEVEVTQWLGVARGAATLSGEAATGLATAVSGMLQSPNFLYRVERAEPGACRVQFDGLSMATRLSYLVTGAPPTVALLDAASTGQLDTVEGIRSAATELFAQPGAAEFMSEFFLEFAGLQLVHVVEPVEEVSDALRDSMLEETRRWVSEVVLAPTADVRSFFDSPTTFVDPLLADFYGLPAPAAGFQQMELAPETQRAGILGKAGFLLAHSSADSTNPTRRGKFIATTFTCTDVPPVPAGLVVEIPKAAEGEQLTTRQLFEDQHRIDVSCVGCHALMDPFGFALEHFDPIGRYRETENGLPIDATGEYGGVAYDGATELGTVLRDTAASSACVIENFYRYANGTVDTATDAVLIEALAGTLAARNYVWRDLLVEFAASDAFTSIAATAAQ